MRLRIYDLSKARRRNRALLTISVVLFAGALTLIIVGYRRLAGWAVLVSCFVNLMAAIAGRRSLDRLGVAATHRDPAG
jgi:hypothetical protein